MSSLMATFLAQMGRKDLLEMDRNAEDDDYHSSDRDCDGSSGMQYNDTGVFVKRRELARTRGASSGIQKDPMHLKMVYEEHRDAYGSVKMQFSHYQSVKQGKTTTTQISSISVSESSMEPKNPLLMWSALGVIVVLFLSIFAIYMYQYSKSETNHDLVNLDNEIRNIAKQFPSQNRRLWTAAFSTIATVVEFKSHHPMVLLLLDHGDRSSRYTSRCLIKKVADVANKFLRPEENKPLLLDGTNLLKGKNMTECVNTFIEEYRPKVERAGAMVVEHLQDVPSQAAEILHFFCDEVTPLVPKAVYLFTMSVSNNESHPTKAAELAFHQAWGMKLERDSLEPLVTRLTSQVFFVQPELESVLLKNCDF